MQSGFLKQKARPADKLTGIHEPLTAVAPHAGQHVSYKTR
jgi:hypothetical protein